MTNQISQLLNQLDPIRQMIKKHLSFLVIMVIIVIYTLMMLRIYILSGAQPNKSQIDKAISTNVQLKINPVVLNKIQQLQTNNIQIQTLFEQARNNPFSE